MVRSNRGDATKPGTWFDHGQGVKEDGEKNTDSNTAQVGDNREDIGRT